MYNSLEILSIVAEEFGENLKEVTFIGGCILPLYFMDKPLVSIRATADVDCLIEVITRVKYNNFINNLQHFSHCKDEDAPICRFIVKGVRVDIIPSEVHILGFTNSWFKEAIQYAKLYKLPNGKKIKVVTPPYFVAIKLETFNMRGNKDYQASHDIEDIISILARLDNFEEDLKNSSSNVKNYIKKEFRSLIDNKSFMEALPGHLEPDSASQQELPGLSERIKRISKIK